MNSAFGKGLGAATFAAPSMSSRSISHPDELHALICLNGNGVLTDVLELLSPLVAKICARRR